MNRPPTGPLPAQLFCNPLWCARRWLRGAGCRAPGRSRACRVLELEELERVAAQDLVALVLGHVGVDLVDDSGRVGILALDVREVRGEHDLVHAQVVADLNADPLGLDAPV